MADAAVQIAPVPVETTQTWSLPLRVGFRFAACYWLLYAFPEPGRSDILDNIPGASYVTQWYVAMWHAIVPWIAVHVFHVTGRPATYFPTGSGDTTLQYIQNLLYVVIATAATIVWSILDRRRPNYRTLHGWLRLLVRYTLAFTLFSYGFAKVFPLQFGPPGFGKLIEPYGDFSPMGVLWSFMGASLPYVIFAGSAEVLGGLLLLFRRTASLGALVSFAVMTNVAALNYCYDVPVKLYSTHLALMALFLLLPDLQRLANVLVLNRASEPVDFAEPTFQNRRLRIGVTVFWVLFVGFNLFEHIRGGWITYQAFYVKPERPPIYGLYDVESGPANWRKFYAQRVNFAGARTADDQSLFFQTKYDKETIMLDKDKLTWSRPDPDHVVMQGTLNGAPTTIRLRKIDTSKFLLLNRGYHWINELPFNR